MNLIFKTTTVYGTCVNDFLHYKMWFTHWEFPYLIEKETVIINNKDKQYEVRQYYYNNNYKIYYSNNYINKFRIKLYLKQKISLFYGGLSQKYLKIILT